MGRVKEGQFRNFLAKKLEGLEDKKLPKKYHSANRKHDTLLHILSHREKFITLEGLWLEFGVFKGESINLISEFTREIVYGFDGFEGFPDDGRSDWEDDFDVEGHLPKVNANVKLLKGWFEETIPNFIETVDDQIAFLHIDCDIYSSTKTIFSLLGDRICSGTVIVFDELLHYNGFENNEILALYEFLDEKKLDFEWLLIRDKVMSLSDYEVGETATWTDFKVWRDQGYEQEVAIVIK